MRGTYPKMDKSSQKQFRYTTEVIVTSGYLIFLCLASILYLTYIYSFTNNLQKHSSQVNTFATNLPPTTPTPHISSVDQLSANKIFEDNFTDDKNHWSLNKDIFKEYVADGKLYFQSNYKGNYAFTGCGACPKLEKPFYLQADLATDTAT